jgi:hypothetical protein
MQSDKKFAEVSEGNYTSIIMVNIKPSNQLALSREFSTGVGNSEYLKIYRFYGI